MRLPLLQEVLVLEFGERLKYRQEALQFYNKLVNLLDDEEEILSKGESYPHKGETGLKFNGALVDKKYKDVEILLVPEKFQSTFRGGFGTNNTKMGIFGFPGLPEDYDLAPVLNYITTNKSNVVHEFMHYLVWKRDPAEFVKRAKELQSQSPTGSTLDLTDAVVFNTSDEFEAYTLQAVHDYMEEFEKAQRTGSHKLEILLPDDEKSFADMFKRKFVYQKFLKNLLPDNQRELERIISSFYMLLKKRGA
jgi:hypothetical protein